MISSVYSKCMRVILELVIAGWILIGRQCLYRSSTEKNSESDSNDIVPCAFISTAVVSTLLFYNTENDF